MPKNYLGGGRADLFALMRILEGLDDFTKPKICVGPEYYFETSCHKFTEKDIVAHDNWS